MTQEPDEPPRADDGETLGDEVEGRDELVANAGIASGEPQGEAADWYRRAVALLDAGSPAAAAALLDRVAAEVPSDGPALREARGRAAFDTGRFEEARALFAANVVADPSDHYAQFGVGLALSRLGDFERAVEHLALAEAMRPDLEHYSAALRHARATLRFRSAAGPGGPGADPTPPA